MTEPIIELPLDKVHPNLRLMYLDDVLDDLCRLVRSGSKLEPIEVFFTGERFQILDGEKRWRVCKKLRMTHIKAIIRDKSEILQS